MSSSLNEFGVPSTASCTPSKVNDNKNDETSAILKVVVESTTTTTTTNESENSSALKIVLDETSQVHKDRNFLLVGRQASTCDIRITHKSLSRQHAVFYYDISMDDDDDDNIIKDGVNLHLVDLNTKTGTFVNQKRLVPKSPHVLKDGDVIQFGKSQPSFAVKWKTLFKPNETTPQQQQQQQQQPTIIIETEEKDDDDQPELTGRAKRQAEIAAMMATLDDTPVYTKYVPTRQEIEQQQSQQQQQQQQQQQRQPTSSPILEKYRLPLHESTTVSESTSASSSNLSNVIIDPSGTRFAVSNMDSSLQLYDFAGLSTDREVTPFSNVIVENGYPIRCMAYSSTSDRLVVATHSAQPKVFDREGEELLQWVRGDVYVTDPAKTIGHTAAVTSVAWHALEKSIVFSTSRDGSLRVWNVDTGKLSFGMLKCEDVVVVKSPKTGRKTIPTCMTVGPTMIWIGTECGSLLMYKYPFVSKLRAQQSTIVSTGEPIISISMSVDGTKVAARTKSGVFVYNNTATQRLSTSSKPIMEIHNKDHAFDGGDEDNPTPTMAFSPNGKTICIGVTSVLLSNKDKNETTQSFESSLQIYSIPKEGKPPKPRRPVYSCKLTDLHYPLVGLIWHAKLNQILVATTKEFQIWYSSDWSKKGVLLNLGRRKRRRAVDGEDALQDLYSSRAPQPGTAIREDQIIAPNALPLFGGNQHQRKKLKERQEEKHAEDKARHKPEPPAKGVYTKPNTIFAQMVMDNRTASVKQIAGKDPREALAAYSEGKSYIGTAYEGNKERILAEKTVEEEEDEMKAGK